MVNDKLADGIDRLAGSFQAQGIDLEVPERLLEMRDDLEREIREHPLKSLAIAIGCGFLLAKLLD